MTSLFLKIGLTLLVFWIIVFSVLRFTQIKHESKKNIIDFLFILSWIIGILAIIAAVAMIISFIWTACIFNIIAVGIIFALVAFLVIGCVLDM